MCSDKHKSILSFTLYNHLDEVVLTLQEQILSQWVKLKKIKLDKVTSVNSLVIEKQKKERENEDRDC